MTRKELGPAMLQIVQAIDQQVSSRMLIACSGGADSLALAAGAQVVGKRRKFGVRAVVIDHGLQAGSADVAQAVAEQLWTQDIAAQIVPVLVQTNGEGMEAAAREARYFGLTKAVAEDEVILLGHTLDDQAETVLLGLARGSGIRSLAGMPASRGPFLRPLLNIRRQTTRQACEECGLQWWDDPQNHDSQFARVRVRKHVLPMLEDQLGPGIAEALARTAESARQDADYLDAMAKTWSVGMEADALAKLDPALRLRVIRDFLREAGSQELGSIHILAVNELVTAWHGQKAVDVPGIRVRRIQGVLQAEPHPVN